VQDKGKVVASPSSPSNDSSKFMSSRMHMKDDCSHVISEIQPQVQINLGLLLENQKGKTVIKERLPLRVASMTFSICVFMIDLMKTMVCRKFGQQVFFWIIWIMWMFIYFWIWFKLFLIFKDSILKVSKGVTRVACVE
jgi:hypothetical protein